jgi:hypothetical protein
MRQYDIFSGVPHGRSPLWKGVVSDRKEAEIKLRMLAETGMEYYAINLLTGETVCSDDLRSVPRD